MRVKGSRSMHLPDADKDIDTEVGQYENPSQGIFHPEEYATMITQGGFNNHIANPQDGLTNSPTTPTNNNSSSSLKTSNTSPSRSSRRSRNNRRNSKKNAKNSSSNILGGLEISTSESPPPLPQLLFEPESATGTTSTNNVMTDSLVGSTFGEQNNQRLSGESRHNSSYVATDNESKNSNTNIHKPQLFDMNFNPDFGPCSTTNRHSDLSTGSHSYHSAVSSLTSNHQHSSRSSSSKRHSASSSASHHSLRSSCSNRKSSLRQNKSSKSHQRGSSVSLPAVSNSAHNDVKLDNPEDILEFINTLRKERSRLLQEIEQEDEVRSAFYAHLDSLNQRLRRLPQQYNVGCERWRVEGEICRVQEALSERLGTPPVMLKRRDQRLHAINSIEKAIQRLRQDNLQLSTESASSESSRNKRSSSGVEQQHQRLSSNATEEVNKDMDLVNANQVRGDLSSSQLGGATSTTSSFHSSIDEIQLHSHHPSLGPPIGGGSNKDDANKLHPTVEAVLKGTWPFEKALWHSSPASVGLPSQNGSQETTPGIMSTSSVTGRRAQSQQQLLTNKVEMVYGLLSMFSSGDRDNMSRTLLAMSSSPDSCVAMRQSGCLPLLIQLLHGGDDHPPTRETRLRASQAIHNIVYSHPDDKRGRREARVLRLLEQLRAYADALFEKLESLCGGRGPLLNDNMEDHPGPPMAALMKLSFDEEHRHAMCALGGLHAIAEIIKRDHEGHGSSIADQHCTTLRRYAGMALTNLTFGDGTNKALLCSFRGFMSALVSQLHSPSEDLRQVTASVLRNLSWRADGGSKSCLREVGAVTALMQAALTAKKESTLKVILSAVWNLSAHCSNNKSDICKVNGALAFICSTLTYKSQSKTLSIIENGGGILRNISSHIALRDDLRHVLRNHNALTILLAQLRSPSLTVVSNACGTLWNLSARCTEDQTTLWKEGAVPMLRSLMNSKHKMISMGSSAALKNLLQAKPEGMNVFDSRSGLGLPTLQGRKQKALEQELDPSLAETCDNIESSPRSSPTTVQPDNHPLFQTLGSHFDAMRLSDSADSTNADRMQQLLLKHHHNNGHHSSGDLSQFHTSKSMVDSSEGGGISTSAMDITAKVNSLGNKYCNGVRNSGDKNGHPTPQVNNFVHPTPQVNNFVDGRNREFEEEHPTDFSLRYSDGDQTPANRKESSHSRNGLFEASDEPTRTFCTEGTPYNISTATSLSDLRDTEQRSHKELAEPNEEDIDLELEDFNESELEILNKKPTRTSKKTPGGASDNPVSYCVEDTPVSLSRISSVSSISSDDLEQRIEEELLEDEETTGKSVPKLKKDTEHNRQQQSNIAEGMGCTDTPLMFSRTTSVSSLSSFEMQSIHDDRSSVVSDFSRLPSGAISPSDLPDSPGHTQPTSPKPRVRNKSGPVSSGNFSLHSGYHNGSDIYRDVPRQFMDEGTPAIFSHGTSLSSLTFDDDDGPPRSRGDGKDSSTATSASDMSQQHSMPPRPSRDPVRSSIPRPQSRGSQESIGTGAFVSRTSSEGPSPLRFTPGSRRTPSEGPPLKLSLPKSETTNKRPANTPDGKLDLDANEKLAAVIKAGQPTRSTLKSPRQALTPSAVPPPPPMPSMPGMGSAIPIQSANLQVTVQAIDFSAFANTTGNNDSLHNFRKEETPAVASKSGSVSNLSEMSIPGDKIPRRSHTTMGSNESVESYEGKKKLERCIQLGLPKPRTVGRPKEVGLKDRNSVLSPRRSPQHRPLPVARVSPAVKVGVVTPQRKIISPFPAEEIKTYAVEGTPAEYSPATSVSNYPVDKPPTSSALKRYNSRGSRPSGLQPPSKVISRGASPLRDNEEIPRRFDVEDTPACLSRQSSLSSLGIGSDDTSKDKNESVKNFEMENTPVTFSRNSSLSSISGDSDAGGHREDALLRTCISQGMPKPSSRIPGPHQRIPQPRSLSNLQSPTQRSGIPTSSNHHEAESRKLSSENEESEKQNVSKLINRGAAVSSQQDSDSSSPEEVKTSSGSKRLVKSNHSWESGEETRMDSSFSESNSVLAEALKVANDVCNENGQKNSGDDMSLMTASMVSQSSLCIDNIKPPSAMGSLLSLSSNSLEEGGGGKSFIKPPSNLKKLECRHTKKMPEMVRRALGDQEVNFYDGGGGASLASSCHSNLDNIFPPSLVGGEEDMESSMISVSSITSEVCEPRDSPPSIGSLNTEVLVGEIFGPARQIAKMLEKEAQFINNSTVTLVAGIEDTSTCQEITDFDKTIAAPVDEVTSDTELAADDLPHDIPDLPQDSPLRSRTSSTAKNSPKLTPKSVIQINMEDRFKTFTKHMSSSNSSNSSTQKVTARQRRMEDADRFRTRTISCDESQGSGVETTEEEQVLVAEGYQGKIVPIQNNNNNILTTNPENRRSFKQRRQENPGRYQTRTIEMPLHDFSSQPTKGTKTNIIEFNDDEMSLTQDQMEVLSQDANIVICSLNENREGMTTSTTGEIFMEENITDIETLSLISNEDQEEVLQLLSSECPPSPAVEEIYRKPRIVKPGEEAPRPFVEDEPPVGKSVRGRRRPLYSSGRHQGSIPCSTSRQTPSSNPQQFFHPATRSATPRSSLIKPNATSSIQPRPTRASTLRQHNLGKSGEDNHPVSSPRPTSSPSSSAGSSPRLGVGSGSARSSMSSNRSSKSAPTTKDTPKTITDLPYPMKRQNTFTKDDAESTSTTSSTPSATEKTSSSTSRVGVATQLKNSLRGRVRKDIVQPSPGISFTNFRGTKGNGPESGSPPRTKLNSKSTSLTREARPPSAKDMAEWSHEGKAKTGKKDVTSRIANLWKRVEKAQSSTSKTPKSKDARVWIGSGIGSNSSSSKKTPGSKDPPPPNKPLFRSSTFEKDLKIGSRSGLALRLSRFKNRDTRSSPPSGATTPIEARPPQSLESPPRVNYRPRPITHPQAGATFNGDEDDVDSRVKRLSRLGSFFVVEEQEAADEAMRERSMSSPYSCTRTPPSKPQKPLQNDPIDDNGNTPAALYN